MKSKHFNPRAPRGARQASRTKTNDELKFQSTRPAWGATLQSHRTGLDRIISIHAPRVGRDLIGRGGRTA